MMDNKKTARSLVKLAKIITREAGVSKEVSTLSGKIAMELLNLDKALRRDSGIDKDAAKTMLKHLGDTFDAFDLFTDELADYEG